MPLSRLPLPKHAPLARAIALVVVACASIGAVGGVSAQQRPRVAPPEVPAPPRAREDDGRSLADSVRRVEREERGQVLSAERIEFDGRNVNRIKAIDDQGRVRVYLDDPGAPEAPPPRRRQEPPRSRGDD